jgi:DNA-binding Lrp family transcriptional regulator
MSLRSLNDAAELAVDDLDLSILEQLTHSSEQSYRKLAELLHVDQRTVAKHIQVLTRRGVLSKTVEIDWAKLGIGASAFVGTTTAVGEKNLEKLLTYLRSEPRVIEAYETVGSHQYLLRILDTDLKHMRDSVLRDLEPLTSELGTSVISSEAKRRDYSRFIRFCMKNVRPR